MKSIDELADETITNERELIAWLTDCAAIADDPALSMMIRVIADIPAEIAAMWSDDFEALTGRLHADTNGPAVARMVGLRLREFTGA